MNLVVLGSGNGVPTARRGCPGFLVRGGGATVLVDPGPGALVAAARRGVAPRDVTAVLLTHLHLDHCHDVPALLFALRHRDSDRPARLAILGPPGLGAWMAAWRATWGRWIEPEGCALTVIAPPAGEAIALDGLTALAAEVPHGMTHPATGAPLAAYGWRLRRGADGPVLAFSGDTGEGEGAAAVGAGADLFVVEATLRPGEPTDRHLDGAAAGRLAARARCRRLLLVHFSPGTDAVRAGEDARRAFDGPVVVGEDGTEWDVAGEAEDP